MGKERLSGERRITQKRNRRAELVGEIQSDVVANWDMGTMKQKTFTFKFYKHEIHPKGSHAMDAMTHADSLKARMVRKGYLVRSLKEEEVIMVSCHLARANVPLKERQRMQEEIINEQQ